MLADADVEGRAARLREALAARTGAPASEVRLVRAPYRICPLGAHVDHQYGAVCALAAEHALLLAWLPVAEDTVTLASRDFEGTVRFALNAVIAPAGDWGDYARGAVRALEHGSGGFVGLVDGAWAEAGLSSSAAVGIAYLLVLAARSGTRLDGEELVRAQGRIEQAFLGLANGLLDPAAVVFGARDSLVRIDTRTLRHERAQAPDASAVRFLAISSGERAPLVAGGAFNDRVAECRAAARELAVRVAHPDPEPRLGDLPRGALATHGPELPEPLARRTRHFLTETARVDAGFAAWQVGDFAAFGAAMRASADSSIHAYETGSPRMIDLLRALDAQPGVYGARFSGAGFRGCCVALVDADAAEDIAIETHARYARLHPEFAAQSFAFATRPAAGAGPL